MTADSAGVLRHMYSYVFLNIVVDLEPRPGKLHFEYQFAIAIADDHWFGRKNPFSKSNPTVSNIFS